jgi:2,5-furandicarboxylate decarboxylase 1
MAQVEWAIATRFQAHRDLFILSDQPSSSLDPSALHVPGKKARATKMGLDATIPWTTQDGRERTLEERAGFMRVGYEEIDLGDYWAPGESPSVGRSR